MERKMYITDEEREKCKRVAEAFAELYELTDTVVTDTGRYGFTKLQYYKAHRGFDSIVTYTDSQSLFEGLWDDWLCDQLLTPVLGTPIAELGYKEMFDILPKEKQEELMAKRIYFMEKSGITCQSV